MEHRKKSVFGFAFLINQRRPVRLLTAALFSGHIPHALLFTGIEGIGKRTAAFTFAMACNCPDLWMNHADQLSGDSPPSEAEPPEPCGQCRSCKKIISGNHPDIIFVQTDGAMIKVDQIRTLSRRLLLKPYEASTRFVIIIDAWKLNPEAGNTLLKTLEEPPENTVFILTAPQASKLLPTIVSRCRPIRFNPISRNALQTYIRNAYDLDPTKTSVIAAMANGSIRRAISMAESDWFDLRNWIIEEMASLSSQSIHLSLLFSETLSKNKKWLPAAFEIMKNWLRDIVIYQYQYTTGKRVNPEATVNIDLQEQIRAASQSTTVNTLLLKIKDIETAEQNIQSNANLRLTLDALIIRLSKEN